MKKSPNQFKILITGILLPIFLFSALWSAGTANGQDSAAESKIIFALKDGSELGAIVQKYSLQNVKNIFEARENLPATYEASIDQSRISAISENNSIEYIESNSSVVASQVTTVPTTNDPFFTMDATAEDDQWYLPKIKIPEAWTYSKGSNSVTVAIVDTGIHASHLELNDGRIVEGYNVVTSATIPANSNSDDNGHGTAVAGVIGAIPNNGKGLAGINWNVKIMPIKALEGDGSGVISSIAQGIVWAVDHGANIINLSLGGPGFGNDQTLNNAIIYAFNKGAVIVSAGGNDLSDQGLNLDTNPVYPICADAGSNMVIGVAASDLNDRKASFSNFGINCIDIVAPGKKILTTAYLPSEPSNNILIYGSGTSLATPIVSGVAALLKASNPNLSNVEIRNIILKTADNIDALNQNNCLGSSCNGFLGKGRINALSALSPQPVLDGGLVRQASTNFIYQVSGGTKRYVSDFVFKQRNFSLSTVVSESNNQLSNLPTGPALPPMDGTLIKAQTDPTVYYVHQGVKRPLTYLVFVSRNFSFANVNTMPDGDVTQIQTGEWYWPPDGTMVLIKGNPTVYVMYEGVRRPVTYFVFTQRKFSFAKVVNVTPDEFSHIPFPNDSFWVPPLEGTLVKSETDSTVYVIQQGSKRALSYEAFTARNYKFSSIVTLPAAEMEVILTGQPIVN